MATRENSNTTVSLSHHKSRVFACLGMHYHDILCIQKYTCLKYFIIIIIFLVNSQDCGRPLMKLVIMQARESKQYVNILTSKKIDSGLFPLSDMIHWCLTALVGINGQFCSPNLSNLAKGGSCYAKIYGTLLIDANGFSTHKITYLGYLLDTKIFDLVYFILIVLWQTVINAQKRIFGAVRSTRMEPEIESLSYNALWDALFAVQNGGERINQDVSGKKIVLLCASGHAVADGCM